MRSFTYVPVVLTLAASAALMAARSAPASPDLLLPGDASLTAAVPVGEIVLLRPFSRDSAGVEHAMGESRRSVHAVGGDPQRLLFLQQAHYRAFGDFTDSLIVRMPGLVPEYEKSITPRGTRTFHYAAGTVRADLQSADSAPVTRTFHYPQPVFAFNQLESIVRSIPYQPGYRRVLPLFSEGDAKLEYDTLSVVGPTPGPADGTYWRVRFADPVIVMELIVEGETRRIRSELVTTRANGAQRRAELEYLAGN